MVSVTPCGVPATMPMRPSSAPTSATSIFGWAKLQALTRRRTTPTPDWMIEARRDGFSRVSIAQIMPRKLAPRYAKTAARSVTMRPTAKPA